MLDVVSLTKKYPSKTNLIGRPVEFHTAVNQVSFHVNEGEVLSLVGESGSGKSTIGKCLLKVTDMTEGFIYFDGQDISNLKPEEARTMRRNMQMIFQDPYSSLNPKHTVREILSLPLKVHRLARTGAEREKRIKEVLDLVGIPAAYMERYPHEFSGGQKQRIGIARALMSKPKLIIADEAVSALDVSIQAQVINLLVQLKKELGLTLLFISHDLAVVNYISDRVAVLYRGDLVEVGSVHEVYSQPKHEYTRLLLSSSPLPDPARRRGVSV
ncbi:ABC transporter ATP-binding protein [Verticiella sediminum]|uniref:ABC transporter ATP-binding protein n=1 Tax=Verticiella sediminum TaxID=1247510 RepID=UPI0014781BBD|nr:ATP-binding cassette domain-containing protein [Verticiella sediminum]